MKTFLSIIGFVTIGLLLSFGFIGAIVWLLTHGIIK